MLFSEKIKDAQVLKESCLLLRVGAAFQDVPAKRSSKQQVLTAIQAASQAQGKVSARWHTSELTLQPKASGSGSGRCELRSIAYPGQISGIIWWIAQACKKNRTCDTTSEVCVNHTCMGTYRVTLASLLA